MTDDNEYCALPLPGREFKEAVNQSFKSGYQWIKDKQIHDNLSNPKFWRLHGKLYDLEKFIDKHPGGQHWLELTRNSDITDYYETFHIEDPNHQKILEQYFVSEDQNYQANEKPFDYKSNGFYQTLKRQAFPLLKDEKNRRAGALMHLQCIILLLVWLYSFHLMAINRTFPYILFSAFSLLSMLGIGHNFLHQSNSIWYYAMDLTTIPGKDWVISHGISHHTYTNLKIDLEITAFEPFIYFLTSSPENPKAMAFLSFIIYFFVPISQNLRVFTEIAKGRYSWRPESLLYHGQILVLILVYRLSVFQSLGLWYCMHGISIMIIARFANHRIEGTWTEGEKGGVVDFGEHILKTSYDHNYWTPPIISIYFFQGFNNHIVHHLFPTIDISQVQQLQPIIDETVREFGLEKYNIPWTYSEMYLSTFKFLIRQKPKVQSAKINQQE